MKYTDGLFTFPVRVYDGASMRKAMRREEDVGVSADGEWVQGLVRIPYSEIKGFIDYFSKGRSVEEVANDGFDCCIVLTNTLGDFICNCSQRDILRKLDSFVEWYHDTVEVEVAKRLLEKEQVEQPPEKKPWWKKFRP